MKTVKRFAVLAIVAFLCINIVTISGCAWLQTVCHPTAEQQSTVAEYKAQAVALLAFLKNQIQVPEVQAAIAGLMFAISVYDQVIAGVCVAVDVIQNADRTVMANQTMARAKMGYMK